MKKLKIFFAAAAAVLALSAYVNKKQSNIRVTVCTCATKARTVKVTSIPCAFTTVNNGHQVFIRTAGGTLIPLYTKVSSIKTCYLKI